MKGGQPSVAVAHVTSAGADAVLCGWGLRHFQLVELSTQRRPRRHSEGWEESAASPEVLCWFQGQSLGWRPNSTCSQEEIPKAFAFRSSMPDILCEKATPLKSQVDAVGYSAAVVYILLLPSCLLYLYWRQREVLRASGATTWALGLQQFLSSWTLVGLYSYRLRGCHSLQRGSQCASHERAPTHFYAEDAG